jgi:hypothetical protein
MWPPPLPLLQPVRPLRSPPEMVEAIEAEHHHHRLAASPAAPLLPTPIIPPPPEDPRTTPHLNSPYSYNLLPLSTATTGHLFSELMANIVLTILVPPALCHHKKWARRPLLHPLSLTRRETGHPATL